MLSRTVSCFLVATCCVVACDKDDPARTTTEPQVVTNTNARVEGPADPKTNPTAPAGGAPGASIASASNASDVRRFTDESAIAPTTSRLVPTTTARVAPLGKQAVAFMQSSVDGNILAKEGDYYRVTFPDPADPARRLAGWVYKDGIALPSSNPSKPVAKLSCQAGEVNVLADGVCARSCAADVDCAPVSGVCDGNGLVSMAGSVQRGRYCVVPEE